MRTITNKLHTFSANVTITPTKRDPSPDAKPTLILAVDGQYCGEFDTYGQATDHLQMLIEGSE